MNRKRHTRESRLRAQLAISVRSFVPPPKRKRYTRKQSQHEETSSEWTLVFDTETRSDAAQSLRFGVYELYRGRQLTGHGVFFDRENLSKTEQTLLQSYASARGLSFLDKSTFIDDVFYGMAYEFRATIVGFNLPFDLSRLAVRHGPARGRTMRGGFTFQLSGNRWKPRIQIKHLSARASLIQFTKPFSRFDTKSMRKNRKRPSLEEVPLLM